MIPIDETAVCVALSALAVGLTGLGLALYVILP
jgi:hypothetical protein